MDGMHVGIRLRLSIPAGVIMEADSDMLNGVAAMADVDACLASCLPGCGTHGWYELIPGRTMQFTGAGDLKVEILPVMLPDEYSED